MHWAEIQPLLPLKAWTEMHPEPNSGFICVQHHSNPFYCLKLCMHITWFPFVIQLGEHESGCGQINVCSCSGCVRCKCSSNLAWHNLEEG